MAASPTNFARGDLQDQKVADYQSPLGVTRRKRSRCRGCGPSRDSRSSRWTCPTKHWELSPARDNAILVCPALSGDAHVAGTDPHTGRPGWWDYHVGPGKAIDTGKFFVICASVLGGCGGTTGPASLRSGTGKPYGMDFPPVTVRDMVSVQIKLLDHIGIPQLFAVIGGSMGGMQALVWRRIIRSGCVSAFPSPPAFRTRRCRLRSTKSAVAPS